MYNNSPAVKLNYFSQSRTIKNKLLRSINDKNIICNSLNLIQSYYNSIRYLTTCKLYHLSCTLFTTHVLLNPYIEKIHNNKFTLSYFWYAIQFYIKLIIYFMLSRKWYLNRCRWCNLYGAFDTAWLGKRLHGGSSPHAICSQHCQGARQSR